MINKNGNNIEGVADFVIPTMDDIPHIYNVNSTVIDFQNGDLLTAFSFLSKDIPTLDSMMRAAQDHTEMDAPVEGIFTFVNFNDFDGVGVLRPVSVKTTSVWCDDSGRFKCTFSLCGRMCYLTSEDDFLNEITCNTMFTIGLG